MITHSNRNLEYLQCYCAFSQKHAAEEIKSRQADKYRIITVDKRGLEILTQDGNDCYAVKNVYEMTPKRR